MSVSGLDHLISIALAEGSADDGYQIHLRPVILNGSGSALTDAILDRLDHVSSDSHLDQLSTFLYFMHGARASFTATGISNPRPENARNDWLTTNQVRRLLGIALRVESAESLEGMISLVACAFDRAWPPDLKQLVTNLCERCRDRGNSGARQRAGGLSRRLSH